MRKRFQHGRVTKSKNRKYWIGKYRDDGPAGTRIDKATVLGKIAQMTKSQAREKLAEIVKPVNSRAAQAANADITVKDFIELHYLPFYKRKWKWSTAMTNEDRIYQYIVPEFGNRK